jgi:outer membrane lipoprotein carrier protein
MMANRSPADSMNVQNTGDRRQETKDRTRICSQGLGARILSLVSCILHLFPFALLFLFPAAASFSADLESAVAGLQKRYASVETVTGSFRQIFRAPGIDQVESGVFRMKKPCLMRWEYRQPEEKLFIADGRNAFLYVPQDRQVTIQPFSSADMRDTPLELLLGQADIKRNYVASWETILKPQVEKTLLIRLMPRRNGGEYESLILEIDQTTFDLRRIVMRESGGNTSEFFLTNVTTNAKLSNSDFQFKPPKGVEKVRMNNEE